MRKAKRAAGAELIGNLITGGKWYGIDVPGMEQVTDVTERALAIAKGTGKFVNGISEIVDQGGDIGAYIKRNAGTVIGGIKEVSQVGATYFGGVPVNNVEAYLLGPWRWIAPGFVTAYEDAMAVTRKIDKLKPEAGKHILKARRDKRHLKNGNHHKNSLSNENGPGLIPTRAVFSFAMS